MGTLPPIQLTAAARVLAALQRFRHCWLLPLLAAAVAAAPLNAGAQSEPAAPASAAPQSASAATSEPALDCSADPDEPSCPTPLSRSLKAIEAYVSAPARWDGRDWLLFGGTLASVGVAHHFDSSVRNHFAGGIGPSASSGSPDTLQDALPAAALFLGTWGYANVTDDDDGRHEAHAMIEAGVLSVATAYAVGYISAPRGTEPDH